MFFQNMNLEEKVDFAEGIKTYRFQNGLLLEVEKCDDNDSNEDELSKKEEV